MWSGLGAELPTSAVAWVGGWRLAVVGDGRQPGVLVRSYVLLFVHGMWYLVSQVSKSTSMATAVAFTALCFSYMGRIRPTPLAAPQKPVRGRGGLPGDARTESAAWRAGDARSAGGDAA